MTEAITANLPAEILTGEAAIARITRRSPAMSREAQRLISWLAMWIVLANAGFALLWLVLLALGIYLP